jgi:phosphoribosylaminoimidazole-succinocarboxamide synthase
MRWPCRQGKVRDVYDLGDGRLLFVASDRISAFDWVLPTPIPDKGRVLTGLSAFWFARLGVPDHLLATDLASAGLDLDPDLAAELQGRAMIVRRSRVIPYECVVRGYLAGSGWKEYQATGSVCGVALPPGLREAERLDEPIFTPATKAETGHDENVPFARMAADPVVGPDLAERLRTQSLAVYRRAREHAAERGLILADTKLEWGLAPGASGGSEPELLLIDEVLTPDSSRFWPAEGYAPGRPQPSFDKQFVRDWLEQSGWDKSSPPPPLPAEVVARTRDKYIEAFERLSGEAFAWK